MNARADFLELRRTGIGGSDIAAIVGASRYKTSYQVWAEKTGMIQGTPDNPAMLWGRKLEPVILQHYAETAGRTVNQCDMLRHPVYPFMVANLDGFTDDKRIVEAKTARRADAWGEPGTDQVPQEYFLQVQWYMAVTGFEVADIAVLIGASDYRQYEVKADPELHELMIREAEAFWACVENGVPPDATGIEDAKLKYASAASGSFVIASADVEKLVDQLRAATAQADEWSAKVDHLKASIMLAMGNNEALTTPDGSILVTWKQRNGSERLDSKALKAAHPDIYAAFAKTGEPTRTFTLKRGTP